MTSRIINADVLTGLAGLKTGSFHCVITSPPYWGLRDYGIPPRTWANGEVCCYGLESTPEAFVANTVEIFSEVRRVLRDDGTLWLNIGDSYSGSWGAVSHKLDGKAKRQGMNGRPVTSLPNNGLKDGDQCLIPYRVAIALQADGWYLRSTIVWAKRSPMPESISGWRWVRCRVKVAKKLEPTQPSKADRGAGDVFGSAKNRDFIGGVWQGGTVWELCHGCDKCRDSDGYILRRGKWRPTTAHEYIFLFSKSERYYCDGNAVQERCSPNTNSRGDNRHHKQGTPGVEKANGGFHAATGGECETRNPRSVWTLSNEPFKGAHFATFPTAIPRRAIEAGTSKHGCCASCGSPYAPVVESERIPTRPGLDNAFDPTGMANRDPQRHVAVSRVTGYRATCGCNAEVEPCRVLDPFLGSGTTIQVANALGRNGTGIEASAAYCEIAERRIVTPPKWSLKQPTKRIKPHPSQLPLF